LNPQKGSACAEAWKHWYEAYGYTKPNYSGLKSTNLFPNKRKKEKENAQKERKKPEI
jgi:hypothetical protein